MSPISIFEREPLSNLLRCEAFPLTQRFLAKPNVGDGVDVAPPRDDACSVMSSSEIAGEHRLHRRGRGQTVRQSTRLLQSGT